MKTISAYFITPNAQTALETVLKASESSLSLTDVCFNWRLENSFQRIQSHSSFNQQRVSQCNEFDIQKWVSQCNEFDIQPIVIMTEEDIQNKTFCENIPDGVAIDILPAQNAHEFSSHLENTLKYLYEPDVEVCTAWVFAFQGLFPNKSQFSLETKNDQTLFWKKYATAVHAWFHKQPLKLDKDKTPAWFSSLLLHEKPEVTISAEHIDDIAVQEDTAIISVFNMPFCFIEVNENADITKVSGFLSEGKTTFDNSAKDLVSEKLSIQLKVSSNIVVFPKHAEKFFRTLNQTVANDEILAVAAANDKNEVNWLQLICKENNTCGAKVKIEKSNFFHFEISGNAEDFKFENNKEVSLELRNADNLVTFSFEYNNSALYVKTTGTNNKVKVGNVDGIGKKLQVFIGSDNNLTLANGTVNKTQSTELSYIMKLTVSDKTFTFNDCV